METITSLLFLISALLAGLFFGVLGFLIVIMLSVFVQYGARRKKREYELMKMIYESNKKA